MKKVRIQDGSFLAFGGLSASYNGETKGDKPTYFEWDNASTGPVDTCFFTDVCFHVAPDYPAKRKIAWFLEPKSVAPSGYEFIKQYEDVFDCILTFYKDMVDNKKYLYAARGGTYIYDWGIREKSKLVSLMASMKTKTVGHRLRHEIACIYPNMDIYGPPYTEHVSHHRAYDDYMYSIVVCNERADYWFMERLIDALAVGTVPILWGPPHIGDIFDERGIISFENKNDLDYILSHLSRDDYQSRLESIRQNYELAHEYTCVEDWLYKHYPSLFE